MAIIPWLQSALNSFRTTAKIDKDKYWPLMWSIINPCMCLHSSVATWCCASSISTDTVGSNSVAGKNLNQRFSGFSCVRLPISWLPSHETPSPVLPRSEKISVIGADEGYESERKTVQIVDRFMWEWPEGNTKYCHASLNDGDTFWETRR